MSLVEVRLQRPFKLARSTDAAFRRFTVVARGVDVALRCDTAPADPSKCVQLPFTAAPLLAAPSRYPS